jgi:hypothetical protein
MLFYPGPERKIKKKMNFKIITATYIALVAAKRPAGARSCLEYRLKGFPPLASGHVHRIAFPSRGKCVKMIC